LVADRDVHVFAGIGEQTAGRCKAGGQ